MIQRLLRAKLHPPPLNVELETIRKRRNIMKTSRILAIAAIAFTLSINSLAFSKDASKANIAVVIIHFQAYKCFC